MIIIMRNNSESTLIASFLLILKGCIKMNTIPLITHTQTHTHTHTHTHAHTHTHIHMLPRKHMHTTHTHIHLKVLYICTFVSLYIYYFKVKKITWNLVLAFLTSSNSSMCIILFYLCQIMQ